MKTLVLRLSTGIVLVLIPGAAFAADAAPLSSHVQLAMALALLISEALGLMPIRAKGIIHGALLMLRAVLENLN